MAQELVAQSAAISRFSAGMQKFICGMSENEDACDDGRTRVGSEVQGKLWQGVRLGAVADGSPSGKVLNSCNFGKYANFRI